ncbi:unnamed protein product, partial [marine sediment metagenome]
MLYSCIIKNPHTPTPKHKNFLLGQKPAIWNA